MAVSTDGMQDAGIDKRKHIWLAGLLCFSLGVWWHREIAWLGMALLLLSAIFDWKLVKFQAAGSLPIVLALVWMMYILISSIAFAVVHEDYSLVMLDDGLRLFYLGGFVLVALALNRYPRYLMPVLILAFAGFFLGRIEQLPRLLSIGGDWWRMRDSMGFPNVIPMAQYSFAVLMGLLLFFPRLHRVGSAWLDVAWAVGVMVALGCVFISQTRSIWLLTPPMLLVLMVVMIKSGMMKPLYYFVLVLALSSLFIAVLNPNAMSLVTHRISQEPETWDRLLAGQWDKVRGVTAEGGTNSIGMRIENMEYGLDKWAERPWFGWGPGGSKMLIDCCAPEHFGEFNDFHSAYVELLVRTGFVGALLFVLLNIAVVREAVKSFRRQELPVDVFWFVILALVLHWLMGLANYRMLNYDWRFYWFLFSGVAIAWSLKSISRQPITQNAQPRGV